MEGFDRLMEGWCQLFSNRLELPDNFKHSVANQTFHTYVKHHVAPPDGLRGDGRQLEEEEVEDVVEPDR